MVCEAFHCLPQAALDAIDADEGGLLFKILDLRIYAQAKQEYDAAKTETDQSRKPRGPTIDRVSEITFELAREEIARRQQQ